MSDNIRPVDRAPYAIPAPTIKRRRTPSKASYSKAVSANEERLKLFQEIQQKIEDATTRNTERISTLYDAESVRFSQIATLKEAYSEFSTAADRCMTRLNCGAKVPEVRTEFNAYYTKLLEVLLPTEASTAPATSNKGTLEAPVSRPPSSGPSSAGTVGK